MLRAANKNIEYEYREIPGKPLIVFLNGAGRTYEYWEPVLDRLGNDYSTLLYNRLGTGNSDKPADPQTAKVATGLLRDVLDALRVTDEINFVTHSMGSAIAETMIMDDRAKIGKVIFIEPTTYDDVRYVLDHGLYENQGTMGETDHVLETMEYLRSRQAPRYDCRVIIGAKTDLTGIFNRQKRVHRKCIAAYAREKNARLIKARNSFHFPQLTDPDLVAMTVREFFR